MKIQKKKIKGGGGVGSGGEWLGWGGGQGGCEWRSEASVKMQKKNIFFGGWGAWVRGGGSGWGGSGRMDGNREVKLV